VPKTSPPASPALPRPPDSPPAISSATPEPKPAAALVWARRRARVEVACPACGATRTIRRDSFAEAPPRCRSCANRANGAKAVRHLAGASRPCAGCGQDFYAHPSEASRRFCSAPCASLDRRRYTQQARTCRTCGREFRFAPKPFSNSSGTFCSRECRDIGFLGLVYGDPARPAVGDRFGWRSRREAFFEAANNFCIVCGRTGGRLHVHHVEGYRNTDFDDASTLVTACPKHHVALESFTRTIAERPEAARRRAAFLLKAVLGDSWCLHAGRLLLQGGASC